MRNGILITFFLCIFLFTFPGGYLSIVNVVLSRLMVEFNFGAYMTKGICLSNNSYDLDLTKVLYSKRNLGETHDAFFIIKDGLMRVPILI